MIFLGSLGVSACGNVDDLTEHPLATTAFSDATRAASFQSGDFVRTKLYDPQGGVLATMSHDTVHGGAELALAGEAAQPAESAAEFPVEVMQNALHDFWSAHQDARSDTRDYSSCRVKFGNGPWVSVSCGLVCTYPSPYAAYGGRGPALGYYTRTQCQSYANQCHRSVYYYTVLDSRDTLCYFR